MVAMQIEIDGRGGVILLDPGYQVGRVITVMIDQQYPHTGKYKFFFVLKYILIKFIIYNLNRSFCAIILSSKRILLSNNGW